MKKNWKKLTIILVLSLFVLGCKREPPKIQWGKQGQQPTAVWDTYNWVIVANED